MKALIFVALINIQLFQTAGSLIAGGCRPPDYQVFNFDCAQNQDVWVQDALFGVVTDGGALRNFCEDAAPNRTTECIPQRPIDTRNIRLACNAVRGQCRPNGPNEMMHSNTFDSCPQTRSFTYGYAVYDCLPALRTTDGVAIDFVYVSPSSLPKSSYEKIYLASSNYDSKGYTTLPVNQCSVKVSSAVLSMVRFTVLDLLGQTTDGSAVSCPYTLSVSGAGIKKDWLACSTWNNYDVYQLNISANSATQVILSVSFNAAGGSTAAQGRFWILVEGITTDGTGSTIEISDGLTSSSTSTTTTPTTTTTTTTPTTTTTTTTSTTTTTPTTTTTTSTTTTTTPSTTTTTRTPTTTSTTTTSINVTPRMTPSSSATTITPTSSTTTTTTTPTTTTQSTTPSTTASTTSISSTTTRSTTATIFSPPVVPPSSTGTMTPSMLPTTDHQTTGNSSASSNSSAVEPDSDAKTSSRVVAIAVGASVAGAVLLFTAVIVIICLCMYCAKKKRKSKPRAPQPVPESVHSGSVASIHAVSPAATIARPSSPGVGGGGGGDDIYSEINESRIDITITGTMNPKNPATVGHQFSLRYTVGGGAGSGGEVSSGGHGHKDRHNVYVHKRMKGRPPQLDEEQWEDEPEVDSPPPYSSDGRRTEPTGQRPSNKRSRWGKSKLYVPPGESGESDTDVQHNPLYGMGLEGGRAGTRSEDYNY